MALYYNVKGSSVVGGQETTELIAPNANAAAISHVMLTNVHATADATVTLLIETDPASGTSNRYNIIHTIAIPADSSLSLDNPNMFKFPNNYGLYITVGNSDTVDVMIN